VSIRRFTAVGLSALVVSSVSFAGGVPTTVIDEVIVTGRLDRLQGAPVSASQGVVSDEQLGLRPVLRTGELMEVVPGLVVDPSPRVFWSRNMLGLKAISICVVVAFSGLCAAASPYAGQHGREIKALSESDIADLLAGKGRGYAKAGELNGYPGPAHVIELASQLELSQAQLSLSRAIHSRMEAGATAAGASLVAAERDLDTLFRTRKATPELLATALQNVANAEAKVREVHLLAHIEQTRVLSPEQIARYSQLRGYGGTSGHHDHAQEVITTGTKAFRPASARARAARGRH